MNSKAEKCLATQDYFIKENAQLKARVLQLEQLLQLNKHALRVSINYSNEKLPMKQLVNALYQENAKLKQCLNRSHQQSNDLSSKLLICQQLVKAGERNEKELVNDLKDKIGSLKSQIKQKQKKVMDLQRFATSYDTQNSLHLRLVEVSAPNILTMKFHEELEQIRQALTQKNEELYAERQKCSGLLKLNLLMTKQLSEIKTGQSILTSTKHEKKNSDLSQMLEYHQKIMNYSDDSMSDISEQQQENKITKPSPVPKLELSKAKQIQQIIVKKINIDQKKKSKNPDTYVKNQEIVAIKKSLHKQLIKNMGLQRKISHLTRIINQLNQRNERLLQSLGSNSKEDVVIIGSVLDFETEQEDRKQARNEIFQLGRDIYQNDNIDKVIYGHATPSLAPNWSKSVMIEADGYDQC